MKKSNKNIQKIQITEDDGEVRVIGEFDSDRNIFMCKRSKSEHFQKNMNAWGLDSKVVDFLFTTRAKIVLKETDFRWTYEARSEDFKLYGKETQYGKHRPQIFLSLDHWNITHIKERTQVLKCEETNCANNFYGICTNGVISINKEGECANYEDY